MAKDFFKWLIIIFIGLWIVWFFTGGPERQTSQGGTFIEPVTPFDTQWKTYGKKITIITETTKTDETQQIRNSFETAQGIAGVSFYKDKVFLKKGLANYSDPNSEYVIIETDKNNSGRIGVSDWSIESVMTGEKIYIGKATYLPYSSKVNTLESVFLSSGDKIYLTTGRSPIGTSFRTNLCTGYFEQFQNFSPALKKECPLPEDEASFITVGPNSYNDECIDLVEDIPRCEINTKTLRAGLQYECQTYIANTNYNSCVDIHKNEEDFYKDEWRIFLNRDTELWKNSRETLRLLDAEGKIVDTITY